MRQATNGGVLSQRSVANRGARGRTRGGGTRLAAASARKRIRSLGCGPLCSMRKAAFNCLDPCTASHSTSSRSQLCLNEQCCSLLMCCAVAALCCSCAVL